MAGQANLWIGGEGSVVAETLPDVTTSEEGVSVAKAGQLTSRHVLS